MLRLGWKVSCSMLKIFRPNTSFSLVTTVVRLRRFFMVFCMSSDHILLSTFVELVSRNSEASSSVPVAVVFRAREPEPSSELSSPVREPLPDVDAPVEPEYMDFNRSNCS